MPHAQSAGAHTLWQAGGADWWSELIWHFTGWEINSSSTPAIICHSSHDRLSQDTDLAGVCGVAAALVAVLAEVTPAACNVKRHHHAVTPGAETHKQTSYHAEHLRAVHSVAEPVAERCVVQNTLCMATAMPAGSCLPDASVVLCQTAYVSGENSWEWETSALLVNPLGTLDSLGSH